MYQKIISIIIILICAILFVTYGRTSFATLTGRPGFDGSLYLYYNVDRIIFGICNLVIALISSCILIFQIKSILKNNKILFRRTSWIFLALVILLIIAEVYLQMSFQGKG